MLCVVKSCRHDPEDHRTNNNGRRPCSYCDCSGYQETPIKPASRKPVVKKQPQDWTPDDADEVVSRFGRKAKYVAQDERKGSRKIRRVQRKG